MDVAWYLTSTKHQNGVGQPQKYAAWTALQERTCLRTWLDSCLQPPWFKIGCSIPSTAMLFSGSPQSITRHRSNTRARSFILKVNSSNKQSWLWSSPLGWLRLCQLHIIVGGSLCPILLLRCALWSEGFSCSILSPC